MKLFIASTFADTAKLFANKVKKGTVIFVANPSDPFKDKYWVEQDYRAFVKYGFRPYRADLRTITAEEFGVMLTAADVVHFCGGSAIYILDLLRRKKMDQVLIRAIREGVVYTGTSAGSMIVAPDISLCADDADEKEAAMRGKIKNFRALGLVPYYIFCHSQEKHYVASTKKAMNQLPKNKVPIIMLNDNMAIWHDGDSMQIEIVK